MLFILEYLYFNLILCLIFLIIIFGFEVIRKINKFRDITKYLPAVYGVPVLGSLYKFWRIENVIPVIGSYFDELKSSSYLTWFASESLIITVDPDIIKHILNSEEFLNKATIIYKTMDDALPNGIITSKVYKWKHNRKLMTPFFTTQNVQRFIQNFQKASKGISKHFDTLKSLEEHDIFGYLKGAILQMAVETTLGTVLDDEEKLNADLAENFNKLLEKLAFGIKLSFLKLNFLMHTPKYYKMIDFLKSYMKNLIERKIHTEISSEDTVFLNRAIKFQQEGLFKLDDTITETYTMIIGSFETTSTTLYSIIVMLAMHVKVQERLYQDLIRVLPHPESNIDYDHLAQLPYLDMVIDETLRLAPPIPLIGREALESCYLTDDIFVPRDFQIIISIFHLHRRTELWGKDADKFNPDNFLPENIEKRHPYAYIPFSKGVRNCIGWRYARISLKILLLELLRNFKFTTSFQYKDLMFKEQISLRFLKEPRIEIIKRKKSAQ